MSDEKLVAEGQALVTGREPWEVELDGAVSPSRDRSLFEDPPEYEGDIIVRGVSINALGKTPK